VTDSAASTAFTPRDIAAEICHRVGERVELVQLEQYPFTTSTGGEPAGVMRVFAGGPVARLVDVSLSIPAIGIDSTMTHVFADAATSVPHFTSDVANIPDGVFINVDLMPRVDLVTETKYLDTVYPPLTDTLNRALALEGAKAIQLPPRLKALCSPWILGATAPSAQLPALADAMYAYLERWFALADGVAPAVGLHPDELVVRDGHHRSTLFDPSSDEVWSLLEGLIGGESANHIRLTISEPVRLS
jgi:hypothetical protein